MQKTSTKPKRAKAERPPQYWRNKWRFRGTPLKPDGSRRAFRLPDGTTVPADERGEAITPPIWPSKEIAEQKALEVLKRHEKPAIYLGPVPCDRNGNPL